MRVFRCIIYSLKNASPHISTADISPNWPFFPSRLILDSVYLVIARKKQVKQQFPGRASYRAHISWKPPLRKRMPCVQHICVAFPGNPAKRGIRKVVLYSRSRFIKIVDLEFLQRDELLHQNFETRCSIGRLYKMPVCPFQISRADLSLVQHVELLRPLAPSPIAPCPRIRGPSAPRRCCQQRPPRHCKKPKPDSDQRRRRRR